jgi:uncharacterized membrane protein
VLAASALRFYRLDQQSGWFDEISTVYAGNLPPSTIVDWLIKDVKNPLDTPLNYWLLHAWFQLAGSGVLMGRVLAACFGILAIPAVYLLARKLLDKTTALLASLIVALSQLAIAYSHEARPFTQLAFLLVVTAYLFIRALRERNAWLWRAATLSAVLMVFTHYYGLFALASLGLFALLYRKKYAIPRTWLATGALIVAALVAVWAAVVYVNHPLSWEQLFKPETSIGEKIGWAHVGAVIGWFNGVKWFGLNSATPAWLLGLGFILFTLPAISGSIHLWRRSAVQREASILLNALWIVPLVPAVGLGMLGLNKYIELANDLRFLVLCAAPYYILAAAGLLAIPSTWLRRIAIILVICFSIVSLRAVYYLPLKADYRSAVQFMAANYKQGDCCLFYPVDKDGVLSQGMLLDHKPGPPRFWQVYSSDQLDIRMAKIDKVLSGAAGCERVWFFWDRTPWMEPGGRRTQEVRNALERTLSRMEARRYYQVEVNLYRPPVRAASPPALK